PVAVVVGEALVTLDAFRGRPFVRPRAALPAHVPEGERIRRVVEGRAHELDEAVGAERRTGAHLRGDARVEEDLERGEKGREGVAREDGELEDLRGIGGTRGHGGEDRRELEVAELELDLGGTGFALREVDTHQE